jgi:hypothetical protein
LRRAAIDVLGVKWLSMIIIQNNCAIGRLVAYGDRISEHRTEGFVDGQMSELGAKGRRRGHASHGMESQIGQQGSPVGECGGGGGLKDERNGLLV